MPVCHTSIPMLLQAEQENEFGDGFHPVDLKPGGADVPVGKDNVIECAPFSPLFSQDSLLL